MRHHYIDRFSKNGSPVSKIKPEFKILLLLVILILILFNKLYLNLSLLFLLYPTLLLSYVPVIDFLTRLLVITPFIFLVILIQYINHDLSVINIFNLVLRSFTSAGYVIIFVLTTPFTGLMEFFRKVKIPSIFIHLFSFLYRYFFIIIEEYEKMERAYRMRKRRKIFSELKILFLITGFLLIRSYERAERVFKAMLMRGYKV